MLTVLGSAWPVFGPRGYLRLRSTRAFRQHVHRGLKSILIAGRSRTHLLTATSGRMGALSRVGFDTGRVPECRRARRNVARNDASRSDDGTVADGDTRQDDGATANPNVRADGNRAAEFKHLSALSCVARVVCGHNLHTRTDLCHVTYMPRALVCVSSAWAAPSHISTISNGGLTLRWPGSPHSVCPR